MHRDVKPENVLFQHRHAVLANFGVARVLAQAKSGERLTGTVLGMTPETLSRSRRTGER